MLAGCADDYDAAAYQSAATRVVEGTPVEINLNVNVPYAGKGVKTRARNLSEAPVLWTDNNGNSHDDRIQELYAVVFDENGLLLEVVECKHGSYESPQDPPYKPSLHPDSLYYTPFHVVLHSSGQRRVVHLVANYADIKNLETGMEAGVLPDLQTYDSIGAYWQRLDLVDGIQIVDTGDVVRATDSTLAYFQYVPLVRNYLKVNIDVDTAVTNFILDGFYVFNRPTSGTIAPYNADAKIENESDPLANRFVVYYDRDKDANALPETRSYENIVDTQYYKCNEPSELKTKKEPTLDKEGSTDKDFPWVNPDSAIYMYERNITKTVSYPTFILFKGRFGTNDPTEATKITPTYYKADFVYPTTMLSESGDSVETTAYYHLIRNFEYTLKISAIHGPGQSTIYDAVNGQAMNNFSVTQETKDLTNIGSEKSRLFVSFTDELFTLEDGEEGTVTLKYKHISDTTTSSYTIANKMLGKDVVDTANNEGYVQISGVKNGKCVEDTYTLSAYDLSNEEKDNGYRTITFTLKDPPESGIAKQTITITSSTGLAREVVIELSKPMTLTATKKQVYDSGLEEYTATVSFCIPAGLSERRFPLTFKIYSSNRNIYPNVQAGEDFEEMPVIVGKVTDTDSNNPTYGDYYYQRTVTWEEYNETVNENGYKWFNCYFRQIDHSDGALNKDVITVTGGSYFGNKTETATLVKP